jgi:hypothetical protein
MNIKAEAGVANSLPRIRLLCLAAYQRRSRRITPWLS